MKDSKQPEFIALNITPDRKRYCNLCNGLLLSDYSCGKCGTYFRPEEARHSLEIRGLDGKIGGDRERTIPIAFIDSEKPKDKDMGGVFEALKKQGYRITSYSDSNI